MKCRVVKKKLPLYAGDDLPARMKTEVEAHLADCARCREESEIYQHSLRAARDWVRSSVPEWTEPDWRRAVQTAASKKNAVRPGWFYRPLKPLVAYAAMGLLAGAVSLLLMRPPSISSPQPDLTGVESGRETSQEVVSMTLVSKETGLKINWYFTKNLNLEEIE